ncbi:hypothetical protein HDU93_003367 [Gonapodya sp. JEL0774]|nr:hypothetical protein HDU93_003367 [Gonapodya sp. JEL0774]
MLDRLIAVVTARLEDVTQSFAQGQSNGPFLQSFHPAWHITHLLERFETMALQGVKDGALSVDPVLVCDFKRAALALLDDALTRLNSDHVPSDSGSPEVSLVQVANLLSGDEDYAILSAEIAEITSRKSKPKLSAAPRHAVAGDNAVRDKMTLIRQASSLRARIDGVSLRIFNFKTTATNSVAIQIREISVPGETFGLETWGAGLILSHGHVLDLGCGVGIAGIAAAKVIKTQVGGSMSNVKQRIYLTDYVPCVNANVNHNIHTNDAADLCSIRKLDWTNLNAVWTESVQPPFPQNFDLIIASDVLYGDVTADLLPNVFSRLLRRPRNGFKGFVPRIHLLTPCRTATWSLFHAQFARKMNEIGIYEVPMDSFEPAVPPVSRGANLPDYTKDPYNYQTDPCAHQILTEASPCLIGAPPETWHAAMVDGYRWGEWRWNCSAGNLSGDEIAGKL